MEEKVRAEDGAAVAHARGIFPFVLRTAVIFLALDGAFKLVCILRGKIPGPEVFDRLASYYYYSIVAVVDWSLAVQLAGRARLAWALGSVFFSLQAAIMLASLQAAATVVLYIFFARCLARREVRGSFAPDRTKTN
jgi:hypothetical protein